MALSQELRPCTMSSPQDREDLISLSVLEEVIEWTASPQSRDENGDLMCPDHDYFSRIQKELCQGNKEIHLDTKTIELIWHQECRKVTGNRGLKKKKGTLDVQTEKDDRVIEEVQENPIDYLERCKLYCSWLDRKISKFRSTSQPKLCDVSPLLQSFEVISSEISSTQGKEEVQRIVEFVRACSESQQDSILTSNSLVESVSSFVKEITANVDSTFTSLVSAKDSIPSPKSLIKQVEELQQELSFRNQEMQSDETIIQEMAAIIQQMRYDKEDESVNLSAVGVRDEEYEGLVERLEQVVSVNHEICRILYARSGNKTKTSSGGSEPSDLDVVKGYLKKLECNLSNLASSFGDGKTENVRYMDDLKKEMHDLQNKFDSHMQFMVEENEILRKEVSELHNLFDHVYQHQNRTSQMFLIESGGSVDRNFEKNKSGMFGDINFVPQEDDSLFSGQCLELHRSFATKRNNFVKMFQILAQSQGNQSLLLVNENRQLKDMLHQAQEEKEQVSKLAHMEKWEREAEYNATIARLQVSLDEQRQKNHLLNEILANSSVFDHDDLSDDDDSDASEPWTSEEALAQAIGYHLSQESPEPSNLVIDTFSVVNRFKNMLAVSSKGLTNLEEDLLSNPLLRSDLQQVFSCLRSVLSDPHKSPSTAGSPAAGEAAHAAESRGGKEEASSRRASEEVRKEEMARNVEEEMVSFYLKAKKMQEEDAGDRTRQQEGEEEEKKELSRLRGSLDELEEEVAVLWSDFEVDMEMIKSRLRSRVFHCQEMSAEVAKLGN
eukprot:765001-Hanusia_phi.AAC.1